jgi:hypothetical protein
MTADSAFGMALTKAPATLTVEDALTVALAVAPQVVHMAAPRGWDANFEHAGTTAGDFISSQFMPSQFLLNVKTPTDDLHLALFPLMLELLAAPETLPDFALAGVLWTLSLGVVGRPAVAIKLLELDAIEVFTRILRTVSPAELIAAKGFARRSHGAAFWAVKELCEGAQAGGHDLTARLLSCGFIDVFVSALGAVEQVGAENLNAHAMLQGMFNLGWILAGEELGQIEDKLRTVPSAFRCVKESSICHITDFGFAGGTFATIMAATLYGRNEDNPFGFVQRDIDGFVSQDIELMRCGVYGYVWPLQANRCRGMLNLCIADAAKGMLLSVPSFIPHLVDGLMLDPSHPRQSGPPPNPPPGPDVLKSVQRDFAECLSQISLFPAGRAALKAEPAVLQALTILKDTALSDEARLFAEATLMVTGDQQGPVSPDLRVDVESLHIMISYQWDVQLTIKRVVAELQRRDFLVWFDLHNMKGSVMVQSCWLLVCVQP